MIHIHHIWRQTKANISVGGTTTRPNRQNAKARTLGGAPFRRLKSQWGILAPKSDHSPGNDSGFQTDHCVNCILGPRLSNSWSHWWATVDNTLEIILKWKTEQQKKNIFLVTSSMLTRQSHYFFAADSRMSQWLRVMSATFKQQLRSLMGNCTQHFGDHLQVLREHLLGQKQRCGLLTGDSSEYFCS